jgi:hypothetical protein
VTDRDFYLAACREVGWNAYTLIKEREGNNLSKIKLKALVKDTYNAQVISLSVLRRAYE